AFQYEMPGIILPYPLLELRLHVIIVPGIFPIPPGQKRSTSFCIVEYQAEGAIKFIISVRSAAYLKPMIPHLVVSNLAKLPAIPPSKGKETKHVQSDA